MVNLFLLSNTPRGVVAKEGTGQGSVLWQLLRMLSQLNNVFQGPKSSTV